MTDLEARIRDAATRNQELLRILANTDHAKPDLEQHDRYLVDLERQATLSNNRMRQLEQSRVKELKEHEKYRDSVMRRFLYKVSGKEEIFVAKADKEEREYFQVLQDEHRETDVNANLRDRVNEARQRRAELAEVTLWHYLAQSELDTLYNSIFAGPTPSFPEEDAREQESSAALRAYHDTRTKAECEQQAARLLQAALQRLERASSEMDRALKHSRMDMWGGGTMNDMMERNALQRADTQIEQSSGLVAQARRFSPFVGQPPAVNIDHGSLLTDVFFDNIFTDMAFHEEIRRGCHELRRYADAVLVERNAANSRHTALMGDLLERERKLNQTRRSLQHVREQAFEKVLATSAGQ